MEVSAARDKVTADLPGPGEGWTSVDGVLRITLDGQLFSSADQGKIKMTVKGGK